MKSNFSGTEIEIWAGFGPFGSTEKKNWADNEQFLSVFFHVFMAKKSLKIFQNILEFGEIFLG